MMVFFSRSFFFVSAFCLSAGCFAQSVASEPADLPASTVDQKETITSEKDSVELVGDSSVGESISRRPDLSFANVTINGQGSGLSLGSIPADAVESVEVMKAVTPDLDADTRNGAISLKTKPTYEQELTAKGTLELEYKASDGSLSNEEIFSWGGRLNEAGTWGGRLNVRQEIDHFAIDDIRNDWDTEVVDGQPAFVMTESRIERFHRKSDEWELGGSLDFKASELVSFSARANWELQDREFYAPRLRYQYGDGTYVSVDSTRASVQGASVQRMANGWSNEDREIEAAVGGVFENDFLEAEFQYVYLEEKLYQPNFFQLDFVREGVDLSYDLTNPRFPVTVSTDGTDLDDASLFVFEDMNDQQEWRNEESDTVVTLDLKWKDLGSDNQGFVKGGFKSRARDLTRVSADRIFEGFVADEYTLADVLYAGEIDSVVEGQYRLGSIPSIESGRKFLQDHADEFFYSDYRTRERADSNSYLADETVDSLYAMFSWEIKKWRSILGWRREQTHVSFRANEVIVGADLDDADEDGDLQETVYLGTNPTNGDNSYSNDFPNFHLRYQWNEKLSVIGSFTNTIKRPGYGEVVPYRRVNRDESEVSEGNPNLKPTLYENLDFSLDYAISELNRFSVELFRKSVEDIVFEAESTVVSGAYAGYELSRRENGPTATIQGAKLTWQAPLRMSVLPEGLSFNANYILNDTETEYPGRPGEFLPVTHLPDAEFRMTLNYQSEKTFTQLMYQRTDVSLLRVGDDPSEDRFEHSRNRINLDFSYQIKPKLRYFVVARDLRSEPNSVRFEGDESRLVRYRNFHWSVRTGLKFEL
ncbi:TonB-dependent receptor domain protein [Verrucomicrobiia bacterium DG1235]|nr:TonB-dependent receptor domain protein [Verrucomicrobiae bacterium DG1235]